MLDNNGSKEEQLIYVMKLAKSAKMSSKANSYMKQIQAINPNSGLVYLMKARNAASSGCATTAFEQSTRYWVAYDIAAKAKKLDPSVAAEAGKLMGQYRSRFPAKNELFVQGLKEGASYKHCSGATTTVRGK